MGNLERPRSKSLIGGTLASDVLHRIREDIISCTLMPGDRLRFEALRGIYGASFSTLREALSILASENLVMAEGQRGFTVAPISRIDLLDVTDARVLIERECLARSIARGGPAWKTRVMAAYHRLDRVESGELGRHIMSAEWDKLHFDFHESLASADDSATLAEFRQGLFERARRYRRLSSITRKSPRAKGDEHRALMQAATSGDVALAQELIEKHVRATAANVLNAVPEVFEPVTDHVIEGVAKVV